MTDPSQYFKGRTVQEQMNEVIGYVDVRSAEVATDAIASDVAQVHQDMLDADADASAAAASAAAAAGTLANAVKKTGEASQSIDGDIDINDDLNVDGDVTVNGGLTVIGVVAVPTPVNNTDAATKKYVDDADALYIPISAINTYGVGLTGNQEAAGIKKWLNEIQRKTNNITYPSTTSIAYDIMRGVDSQNNLMWQICGNAYANGTTRIYVQVRNSDGTWKSQTLLAGDII